MTGVLGSGARIGVAMENPGTFTSGLRSGGNTGTAAFFSDTDGYNVTLDESTGEAMLTNDNNTGRVSVTVGSGSGSVTTYYDTLEAAFDKANNAGAEGSVTVTVRIYEDMVVGASIPVEADVTLDLNGHTVMKAEE